jgi:hypothetical protein
MIWWNAALSENLKLFFVELRIHASHSGFLPPLGQYRHTKLQLDVMP